MRVSVSFLEARLDAILLHKIVGQLRDALEEQVPRVSRDH